MRQKTKTYYESNRISFQKLSDNSKQLFGQSVSLDQLKKWSSADGGWNKPKLKEAGRLGIIRDKLFEAIENLGEGEIPIDVRDLTQLTTAYMQVISKAPPDINVDDAKPTLDQIKDEVRKNE